MLPLVLMVMWVFILPKPEIINTENAFPLFLYAFQIVRKSRVALIVISLLFVVLQAFFLTHVINKQGVLRDSSHLPALLFVILMSCFPEQLSFNPRLFANFFIIVFLNSIFNFYRSETAVFEVFNAGVFIGLASLFYWPSLFLFPLTMASLFVLRPFNIREWLVSFFGVLLPFLFFGAVLFWLDMLSVNSIKSILEPLYSVKFSTAYNGTYIILTAILAIILIAALWRFSRDLNNFSNLRARKFLAIIVWFFLFAALSYLVASKNSMIGLSFLAVPLSVIISNYFLSLKNQLLAELIFLLLLAAVIYNQVLYFLQFNNL